MVPRGVIWVLNVWQIFWAQAQLQTRKHCNQENMDSQSPERMYRSAVLNQILFDSKHHPPFFFLLSTVILIVMRFDPCLGTFIKNSYISTNNAADWSEQLSSHHTQNDIGWRRHWTEKWRMGGGMSKSILGSDKYERTLVWDEIFAIHNNTLTFFSWMQP